ncbi:putative endonuclease [Amycolatopsis arida]|uniref:Putative endonuclease n=2 Tax=Amycolatopsis arida TaxID=587909 RepID=A0A1I5KIP9_9PSEU|nr:putative endonuclease [Amycolatopsis arida]SFO84703.1 putative endonuclease [Amycolatopsis arida]
MRVLSRNWRCRAGELDLVATDYRGLIVCEVKTRSGDGFGAPEEAVTQEKVHRLWRLAHEWKRHHNLRCWCPLRFDVIAVSAPPGAPWTLRHFPAVGAER